MNLTSFYSFVFVFKIADGHYYYAFVDHGGLIVAVKKYGLIDTLS